MILIINLERLINFLEILKMEEKVSKQGNEMIEVTLCAYGIEGEKISVRDWIVNPTGLWKLKALCECCGIPFDGKTEPQMFVGKRLMVKLSIQKQSGDYPERNKVAAYVDDITAKNTNETETTIKEEDDIPF